MEMVPGCQATFIFPAPRDLVPRAWCKPGLWGTSLNADGFIILQLSVYSIATRELVYCQVIKINVAETEILAFPSFFLLRTWHLNFPWCNSANILVRDLVSIIVSASSRIALNISMAPCQRWRKVLLHQISSRYKGEKNSGLFACL